MKNYRFSVTFMFLIFEMFFIIQTNSVFAQFDIDTLNSALDDIVVNETSDYYFEIAWKYVKVDGERSYNAVANYLEAVRLNPTNGGYYNDLANCFRGGFQDFTKADEYYTKAIDNGFKKSFTYYNRAICRFELGNYNGAKSDLLKSRELGWNNDYYKLGEFFK